MRMLASLVLVIVWSSLLLLAAGCGTGVGNGSQKVVYDFSLGGKNLDLGGSGGDPADMELPGGADAGGCSKPGSLHPPKMGKPSIYCPFGANNMAAYCQQGTQHCCEPSGTGSVSTCQPMATPCAAKETDWQCQDPSDCGMGAQCCSNAGAQWVMGAPGCANFGSHFNGSHCAAHCLTGQADPALDELTLCTSTSQCANGTTCTTMSTKGVQIGVCH